MAKMIFHTQLSSGIGIIWQFWNFKWRVTSLYEKAAQTIKT